MVAILLGETITTLPWSSKMKPAGGFGSRRGWYGTEFDSEPENPSSISTSFTAKPLELPTPPPPPPRLVFLFFLLGASLGCFAALQRARRSSCNDEILRFWVEIKAGFDSESKGDGRGLKRLWMEERYEGVAVVENEQRAISVLLCCGFCFVWSFQIWALRCFRSAVCGFGVLDICVRARFFSSIVFSLMLW